MINLTRTAWSSPCAASLFRQFERCTCKHRLLTEVIVPAVGLIACRMIYCLFECKLLNKIIHCSNAIFDNFFRTEKKESRLFVSPEHVIVYCPSTRDPALDCEFLYSRLHRIRHLKCTPRAHLLLLFSAVLLIIESFQATEPAATIGDRNSIILLDPNQTFSLKFEQSIVF